MDIFYIIVLTVATIILILMLTYIGIQMRNKTGTSGTYPPVATMCPDYWTVDNDGISCKIPDPSNKNAGTLYKDKALLITTSTTPGYNSVNTTIDFTDKGWTSTTGKTSVCAQKQWASTNNVMWDGVSNYNGC
jgi:hypothetical protein